MDRAVPHPYYSVPESVQHMRPLGVRDNLPAEPVDARLMMSVSLQLQ